MKKNLPLIIRVLVSALFLLSAFAKLYPTPMFGITKVFEQGQLIPMGFPEDLVPYLSRFILAIELLIAFAILQKNYLKKLIIPSSIGLLVLFSLHLTYSIFLGDTENCGCFGDLIPMSPLQALIKNLITIVVLGYLYKNTADDKENSCSKLSIQFLSVLLVMFAFLPVSSQTKSEGSSFVSFVEDENFKNSEDYKILCYFDAGCEHCQHAARSLDSLSNLSDNFPPVHIVFSDTEQENIPNFFEYVGNQYPYQVMPFANYDTDEVDSYMEITFPDYDNPIVILYKGAKQIRLFDGTGYNEYHAEELQILLDK
tara:strand:- start:96 stop:1031 length:936 start_codon:yes stop_codon:yes gene_type:complete